MAKPQYLTLSKRIVDRLSADDKDAVFRDRDLPGFGVRVYSSGAKVYVVQTRAFGRSERVTVGRHGEVSADRLAGKPPGSEVDKGELRRSWERQATEFGFSAEAGRAKAKRAERQRSVPDLFMDRGQPAADAAVWAVAHLSERQAVFGHGDLLAAALSRELGAVTAEAAERAIPGLEREGGLHTAKGLDSGRHWTADAAMARESEAIALMRAGMHTAVMAEVLRQRDMELREEVRAGLADMMAYGDWIPLS